MKTMKRFLSCMLIVSMIMSFMSVSAFADETGEGPAADIPAEPVQKQWPLLEGEKTAAVLGSERTDYQVTVQIPGGEGIQKFDQVIVMVDGSYSMDEEWNDMKEALATIGDTVLNGSGSTRLSLLTFGMSPNVVTEDVKSVEEMRAGMPVLPGGLLYGRSSTNCHAAFLGLREYVAELRESAGEALNNVYVLFLSDGGVNQYAVPVDWNTYVDQITASKAATAHLYEMDCVYAGVTSPSKAFMTVFGEEYDTLMACYGAAGDGLKEFRALGGTNNETIGDLKSQKTAKEEEFNALPGLIEAAKAELELLTQNPPLTEGEEPDVEIPEGEGSEGEEPDVESPEQNAAVIALENKIAEMEAKLANYPDELNTIDAKLTALTKYVENKAAYEAIQNSASEAEGLTKAKYYVRLVWDQFYEGTGFDPAKSQPIHVMETAFLKYQEAQGIYIENCFYYVATCAPISGGDQANGEYAAEQALALTGEVNKLYMVRYGDDDRSGWMEGIEGAQFDQSTSIATLADTLKDVLVELEQTPYNDVVVTDYMSKWVNLKPETIKVLGRDGNVVAAFDEANSDVANGVYNYKWVGTPLCEAKAPIVLEKVAAEDYAAGGDNVIGNTNGDIYKLTWNIKDGALYRADNYKMQYEVTVDEQEYGFQYNTSYPANGNTDLEYLDENNESKTNDIEVPNVDVPKTDTPIIILPPVQEENPDSTPTEPAEPEEVIEVEEEEPPLADIEEPDVPLADIEELEEEEVPLTDVPKTGDSSNMMLWMMMALLSAAALAGIRIAERKER